MNVAILKYNAGNLFSVDYALRRLGVTPIITDNKQALRNADRVIFPGVGEAETTMNYLRQHQLDRLICSLTQPVLGICLGMQLLCRYSEEGDTPALGIFDIDVKRFQSHTLDEKVPHMGWNSLSQPRSQLFDGFSENEFVYFVHSYYVPVCPHTAAQSLYIHPFSAALQKDNFFATQFHPEKSGEVGERILHNFLNLERV